MATANHVLLRRITLSASASSVTFDSIPQTGYTDLKIVVSCATSRAADEDGLGLKLNTSTTGYSYRVLTGDGASAGSINTPYGQLWSARIQGANAGANIFSSTEIYIPNYAGSNAKSYSADSVTEKNGTNGYITMAAISQTSTSPITSIELSGMNANFIAGSSFSLYGIANSLTTPTAAPKADGGDIIKTDGTYWYHAFLSTGSFKPQVNLTADVLVIGGGGGASARGNRGAGGGGAGGLVLHSSQILTPSTYSLTVGAGGSGSSGTATSGVQSQFGALTAAAGGGRGAADTGNGQTGGSGGGGWIDEAGYAGTSGQGYAGGAGSIFAASNANTFQAGGGGGAGGTGYAGVTNGGSGGTNGAGGIGSSAYSSWGSATSTGQNVSGTYYYAGGGGGGSGRYDGGTGYTSVGGSGGGGAGSGSTSGNGIAGTASTGSGGGGSNGGSGGAGGSGIIIIRYPVA